MIGVMPLWDDDKESIWMLPGYLDGIREAGGLPVIFPLSIDADAIAQLCDACDGFLLTGGHDVCPEFYGEERVPGVISSCEKRDNLEKQVLSYAIQHNKAVLGICRGIQLVNAALGGTLYQDINTQYPAHIDHRMAAPYDRVCHTVSIAKDSELFRLLQVDTLGVNSCHHQAVKTLAPGLKVMAKAEDGIVEALCMEGQ